MSGYTMQTREIEEIAGLDCREYDKYLNPTPCGTCRACLARAVIAAEQRAEEAHDVAMNLLAVIHRDGGHHAADHGLIQSGQDAQAIVLDERAARERAEAERDRLLEALKKIHGNYQPACGFCTDHRLWSDAVLRGGEVK